MDAESFRTLLAPVTEAAAGRQVDAALADDLNARFPADGPLVRDIEAACHAGIAEGLMCAQGGPGRRFGRVIEAAPETGNLSVDVVDLEDVVAPHHRHPKGEILLVMPQDDGATFDRRGAGWMCYAAGTAHRPTVKGGRAVVLYMLPDGEIEFTG